MELKWLAFPAGSEPPDDPGTARAYGAFRLTQRHVTAAEFRAFVAAPNGYAAPRWWRWGERGVAAFVPRCDDRLLNTLHDNGPCLVTDVEAVAYTRWWSAAHGGSADNARVTLCDDLRWRAAARTRALRDPEQREWTNTGAAHVPGLLVSFTQSYAVPTEYTRSGDWHAAASFRLCGYDDPPDSGALARLAADPTAQARGEAVAALGQWGGAKAFDALLPLLDDPLPAVRALAAASLGFLGDPRAADPLAALMEREAAGRVRAACALALLGDERALSPLLGLLENGSPGDARRAAVYLSWLHAYHPFPAEKLLPLLSASGFDAAPTFARIGAAAVDALIEALQSADEQARVEAARALAAIGDKRALPRLLDVEVSHEQTARLRKAIHWLERA